MKSLSLLCALAVGLCVSSMGTVRAADKADEKQAVTALIQSDVARQQSDKDWSVEVGSGALFSNVRSPKSVTEGYMIVPVETTFALKLDDPADDEGIFRGNTEFLFRSTTDVIAQGIESQLLGANFGPRYNFVQPGWPVVPFVEATVGFAFADSRGEMSNGHDVGLGQDFNFNFTVAMGFRYDINETWFMRLAAVYTHYSNAGLSEPRENRPIDAAGPELSVGMRF